MCFSTLVSEPQLSRSSRHHHIQVFFLLYTLYLSCLRWAMGTSSGIQAGVMWTIVAGIQSFIKDRWKIDPTATVVFTGGDGQVGRKFDANRTVGMLNPLRDRNDGTYRGEEGTTPAITVVVTAKPHPDPDPQQRIIAG